MMTYRVHMRSPRVLWRQLGWCKFVGFQITFLMGLCQFVLEPFLWSFWIILFGITHPVELVLGPHEADIVIGFFLATLALDIILSLFAIGRTHHRGL
jgi:hypothetical protein